MERRSPVLYAHRGSTCPRPVSHEPGKWLRVKARYANMLVSGVSEGGNRLVDDAKRVRAVAAELAARPTRRPAAKRGAGREEPWADAGVSGTSRRRTERTARRRRQALPRGGPGLEGSSGRPGAPRPSPGPARATRLLTAAPPPRPGPASAPQTPARGRSRGQGPRPRKKRLG